MSLEEALRMNLFNIKTWSLGSDLRSATRTAGAVLAKRGAH
jgi:lipopolysaccharide/colanic/teichoic acid biosynthesis glycosyltransferase